MSVKYPDIEVQLSGEDGNPMMIVSRVGSAMRRAGIPEDERKAFAKEALSGDYDHVIQTAMAWVNVA